MSELYLEQFNIILQKFCLAHKGVTEGKMMSSPALKFNNKVFAFYYKDAMGFRLGPKFDPLVYGLKNAKLLSPFKTKPPLKAWFMIDKHDSGHWNDLTELALVFTMTLR